MIQTYSEIVKTKLNVFVRKAYLPKFKDFGIL